MEKVRALQNLAYRLGVEEGIINLCYIPIISKNINACVPTKLFFDIISHTLMQ